MARLRCCSRAHGEGGSRPWTSGGPSRGSCSPARWVSPRWRSPLADEARPCRRSRPVRRSSGRRRSEPCSTATATWQGTPTPPPFCGVAPLRPRHRLARPDCRGDDHVLPNHRVRRRQGAPRAPAGHATRTASTRSAPLRRPWWCRRPRPRRHRHRHRRPRRRLGPTPTPTPTVSPVPTARPFPTSSPPLAVTATPPTSTATPTALPHGIVVTASLSPVPTPAATAAPGEAKTPAPPRLLLTVPRRPDQGRADGRGGAR